MDAFGKMETSVKALPGSDFSGTTATVVVYDSLRQHLAVANVGDSTAVLGRREQDSPSEQPQLARQISHDHDPSDEDEQRRICNSGGVVTLDGNTSRVYKRGTKCPGLNLSRSLGDKYAHKHCGVLADPEVRVLSTSASEEDLLLVCSDGVWGVFTPEEAISFVSAYPASEALRAAEALAKEAWRRWDEGTEGCYVDDVTAVLVNLRAPSLLRAETGDVAIDPLRAQVGGKACQQQKLLRTETGSTASTAATTTSPGSMEAYERAGPASFLLTTIESLGLSAEASGESADSTSGEASGESADETSSEDTSEL